MEANFVSRRDFVKVMAVSGTAVATGLSAFAQNENPVRKTKLGFDNFAVRAMKWNASQLIDYAVQLKCDSLFITDLNPSTFESFNDNYLRDIKKKADDNGLQLQLGGWSICPTSKHFKKDWGTAEEHLALGIRVAKTLGSSVFRCILGMGDDRKSDGGIDARIADTVEVLKKARSQSLDAGVKIAVENHAGDMQSWELVSLIEAAGKDFVGANIDSGNACWTMEDPIENLKNLAPYVLTTSLRDSAVWESETGATIQWTAMGEGNTNLKTYFAKFIELCPGVTVNIETISGFNREVPFLKEDFWNTYPKMKAKDFAKFLALTKTGKARAPHKSANAEEEQAYQKGEVERSIKYCKEVLGLGLKT